jgi:osmoprotectant transport system permease protein
VLPSLEVRTTAAAEPRNPWFSWDYLRNDRDFVVGMLQQHVRLTVAAVILALLVAVPLALLARRWRVLAGPIVAGAGVLYTIPSLGLFAMLAPFTGFTLERTVLVGLVVYALLVLLRNTIAGLAGVPADVVEAARGMGYGGARLLWRIELPLALPVIMTGVRIATVSTVALVTIGVINGNGGLGQVILRGFQSDYRAQVVTGTALCVVLALAADLALVLLMRVLTPWSRRRA